MDINNLITLAVECHQRGEIPQAERLYKEILKIQPDNFPALHCLGIIYLQRGNYDFAAEYFKKALEINSSEASIFYNLGIVFQRTGRLDEAVISYKKSIELNPDYADSHYNLGNVFRHKESPDEAVECFQRALRLNPHFPEASGALKTALKEKEQLTRNYEDSHWIHLIGKKLRLESLCHPHCQEEKAHLFRTFDGGGTEIEVLNFLRSLITLFKPKSVLETGTWNADGTVALSTAVKENGFGKVISLEIDFQRAEQARMKIHSLDLTEYVQVIHLPSLEYIEKLDSSKNKFDFAFFDSRPSIRPVEFQKLYDKGALTDIVVFHDTSRLREVSYIEKDDPQDEYVRRLDQIELLYCRGGLENPLSKGVRVMQLRRDINPAFIAP